MAQTMADDQNRCMIFGCNSALHWSDRTVAAKNAARSADEGQEEKLENLSTIHLDPAGVEMEPDNAGEQLVTREVSRLIRSGSAGEVPVAGLPDGARLSAAWRFGQPACLAGPARHPL